jgi:phospholipid/cholesterol/gamma-HCH transport system ATP-binding protein
MNAEDNVVIRLRGIRNQFGSHVVHEGLDLDIRRGEIVGIVGGSGTGKSVLLRTIVGLQHPAAGSVEVLGVDILNGTEDERQEVQTRWGVLFQDGALFSSLTVRENVEVPLEIASDADPEARRALAELKVAMSGLPLNANDKYPSELSGGMRKRAGLARALALDPEIVFLDEPTAGLDPIGAADFDQLIAELRNALGLTVFMVTHDLDSLHAICDRIVVLAEKKVLASGTITELKSYDHPWVRDYFNGPRARAAELSADVAKG